MISGVFEDEVNLMLEHIVKQSMLVFYPPQKRVPYALEMSSLDFGGWIASTTRDPGSRTGLAAGNRRRVNRVRSRNGSRGRFFPDAAAIERGDAGSATLLFPFRLLEPVRRSRATAFSLSSCCARRAAVCRSTDRRPQRIGMRHDPTARARHTGPRFNVDQSPAARRRCQSDDISNWIDILSAHHADVDFADLLDQARKVFDESPLVTEQRPFRLRKIKPILDEWN